MSYKSAWKTIKVSLLIVGLFGGQVAAQTSTSPNYKTDEYLFSTGSERDLNSANYQGQATVGDLGIGMTESDNYRAYAGFNTTDEPYLEFVVVGSNIDLGYINTTEARTANATFYVRAWQASGYVVRTESNPPTNQSGGYQITPLPAQTVSAPGTKQFGINLVANTRSDVGYTPFGSGPQQVPDATFSFGYVAPDYNTADEFRHVKSDVIAQADESTSVTTYTVSYLFNIDEATPSGRYDFSHDMVATATY
ncbi:MAG TPA: hypothetical protein VK674_06465 [Candidatus Limnocylindria bacterium]|nr:hypothetical protein [Candidatus Limnocylindria bacterium]